MTITDQILEFLHYHPGRSRADSMSGIGTALLALVLLSYVQPFMDGNKRTARIVANAIFLAHGHCPLSFRTVRPDDYREALLLFYEQNNLSAFKRLFVEQVEFAVRTYF